MDIVVAKELKLVGSTVDFRSPHSIISLYTNHQCFESCPIAL